VIRLTDLDARKNVSYLGNDMFTFAVPYRRFPEMETNVEASFLKKKTWSSLLD